MSTSPQPQSSSVRPTRCGIDGCRSRRFHTDNGLLYCHRGHLQEGRVEQAQEFEDINWSASQTVRIRDSRKQAADAANAEAQSGPRGVEAFLLAYQALLRGQCVVLMERMGFEDRFEAVVREVWGLRVGVAEAEGVLVDGGGTGRGMGRRKGRESRDRHEDGEGSSARQMDDVEAQDDAHDDGDDNALPPRSLPKLMEQFAILYLSALILRIPLPIHKLQHWVQTETLHYIRAQHEIPDQLRSRMSAGMQQVFQPSKTLQPGDLHQSIAELSVLLHKRYSTLVLPALSWHALLADYTIRLALPLPIYEAVEGISTLLGLDYTLASARRMSPKFLLRELPELQLLALIVIATKLYFPFHASHSAAKHNPKRRKLSHSEARTADPSQARLILSWPKWHAAHNTYAYEQAEYTRARYPIEPGKHAEIDQADIWRMKSEQLDAYMDWYQDTWMEPSVVETGGRDDRGKDPRTGVMMETLKQFPVQEKASGGGRGEHGGGGGGGGGGNSEGQDEEEARQEDEGLSRLMRAVHGALETGRARGRSRDKGKGRVEENGTVIGMDYVRYRKVEELEDDPTAKMFHETVADRAGVPLKLLVRAVRTMEDALESVKGELIGLQEIESEDDGDGG